MMLGGIEEAEDRNGVFVVCHYDTKLSLQNISQ